MFRYIAVIVTIILLGLLAFRTKEEEVHFHAGFQVYKDNQLLDFSDIKYMHLEPCSLDHKEGELTSKEEQLEKAHLHDNIGDVVHVHHKLATWGDLFLNIGYELSTSSAVFINSSKFNGDILKEPIKAYDSVVIFLGENKNIEEKVQNAVVREHILEVESRSETCGD